MTRTTTILAASVTALVLAGGCYEQELRVKVHERGAGTIRITERIGPRSTEEADPASVVVPDGRVHGLLVDELASWGGVCAWTDTASRVEKDGAIFFAAKGYFEDVNALHRDGLDGLTHRFDLRTEGDTMKLAWTFVRRGEPEPDTLEHCRSIVATLKGTRIEATVTLPGAVLAEDGASEPGYKTARWVLFSGAELDEEFRTLEAKLRAGSIAERELVAAVQARLARTVTARCRTGESSEEQKAFRDELARAKTEFAESDLAREIENAKRSRPPNEAELR